MFEAGLCTIAFRDRPVGEVVDLAAEAGADAVEVWGRPPHVNYPLDPPALEALVERARRRGVEVAALGSYYRAGAETAFDGVAVTPANQVELAERLDADVIRIWAGDKNLEQCAEHEVEAVCRDVRTFARRADRAGKTVVLERHENTLLNGWRNVEDVLERIGEDNVRLNYQVPCPATNENYRERAVEDYRRLLPRAAHAHLQNFVPEDEGWRRRTFLEEGIVDYSELGAAARRCGYAGRFMVEFAADRNHGLSPTETVRHDIEFIHSL